jgi:large subunit ribosomal protein L32e
MAKEDIIQKLTSLKGIGESKAEALVEAGYDTIEKIQSASITELTAVKGISDVVAQSLQDQLGKKPVVKPKVEEPAKKQEKKAEKKPEAKPKKTQKKEPVKSKKQPEKPKKEKKRVAETVEKKPYEVKLKPALPDDIKKHLSLRKDIKKRTPEFLREEWFRYKRIPKNWRRPDGITSKMRRHYKYRPSVVRVGFRGPKKVRGLHASGFEEVMVYRPADLESMDPKTQAARIGGSVGTKKRLEIEKKAKELDIRLLNK